MRSMLRYAILTKLGLHVRVGHKLNEVGNKLNEVGQDVREGQEHQRRQSEVCTVVAPSSNFPPPNWPYGLVVTVQVVRTTVGDYLHRPLSCLFCYLLFSWLDVCVLCVLACSPHHFLQHFLLLCSDKQFVHTVQAFAVVVTIPNPGRDLFFRTEVYT